MKTVKSTCRIRWATAGDVDSILQIERAWRHEKEDLATPELCLDFISTPAQPSGSGRNTIVCDHPVRGVIAHLHIVTCPNYNIVYNIATHPAYVRKGVATRLLQTLAALPSRQLYRPRLITIVRESALMPQLLLKSFGFSCTQVLPCHYIDPPETAYYFERLRLPNA